MQDNPNLAIEPLNLANDYFLSTEMSTLEQSVLAAAQRTANEFARGLGITWTDTEMEAVVTVQVLKELNSVDLATMLLRYKYFRKIREGNIVTRHPGGYTSLTHLASEQGISATELSRIVDLVEVVFPYLGNTLHMDVATAWKEVGKSNFIDMLPVLKALITGQPVAHSNQANQAAARFMDDAAAGYLAQNMDVPAEDDLRQEVVRDIIERGTRLNNHELRTHLRPERVPSIETHVFMNNGQGYVLMPITNDQMSMLSRRAGACIDVQVYDNNDAIYQAAYGAPVRNFLRTLGLT